MPYDDYECLNVYYQMIAEDNLFADWWVLDLAGKINVPALANVYMRASEVPIAEPNGVFGGQNFWVPTASPTRATAG